MPRIQDGDELVRIELPAAGEWVEVLPRMSRGQEVRVRQATVRGGKLKEDTEIDAEVAIEAAEFAMLEIVVRRWSWPDPVTPAGIRELDGPSIDAIKARLNELYGARSTDEKNG